eukprot:7999248-Pyramimonas_sp.AAC.1
MPEGHYLHKCQKCGELIGQDADLLGYPANQLLEKARVRILFIEISRSFSRVKRPGEKTDPRCFESPFVGGLFAGSLPL